MDRWFAKLACCLAGLGLLMPCLCHGGAAVQSVDGADTGAHSPSLPLNRGCCPIPAAPFDGLPGSPSDGRTPLPCCCELGGTLELDRAKPATQVPAAACERLTAPFSSGPAGFVLTAAEHGAGDMKHTAPGMKIMAARSATAVCAVVCRWLV